MSKEKEQLLKDIKDCKDPGVLHIIQDAIKTWKKYEEYIENSKKMLTADLMGIEDE